VQVLSFVAGILIVRRLPVAEYAYYTIATAMLSTMTALADGGIGAGVISQGGKVWKDPVELGKVVASGLALRRRFALLSAVAAPFLIYFLRKHGASWAVSLVILACLIPTFLAALSDSLLEVAPKLHQAIPPLQRNQIETAFGRSLLTILVVFTWPTCALAVLATGISRTWANMRLRKIASGYADRTQKADPEIEKKILTVVWRILPASIYYCISSQITIWVISIFGSTVAVGQLGGLTGLAQAMTLLTTLVTTLLVPRFARLPENKRILVTRFVMAQAGLIVLGLVITGMASLFGVQILWLLGKQFGGMQKELTLAFASACVTLLSSTNNQLLSARGIVVPPAVFIGFALVVQVGLALVLPLREVYGALLYGLLTALALYLLRLIYFAIRMRQYEATAEA
jgi:O-antigen/teichoic acid export membrane protein